MNVPLTNNCDTKARNSSRIGNQNSSTGQAIFISPKIIVKIEEPSFSQVNIFLNQHRCLEKIDPWSVYKPQRECVECYFGKFPKNNILKEVLSKAHLLNSLYNTRISNNQVKEIANHIVNIIDDFDCQLGTNFNFELVGKIASVGIRRNYSFATKYCHFHKQEKYPIYDSFVDDALWYFHNEFEFCDFKRIALRDYSEFCKTMNTFRDCYKLENFSWIEIDRYLWHVGKKLKEIS